MSEIKVNQTFIYTGGTEYTFDNVVLDTSTGFSLNSIQKGNGGIGSIPYNGATVTMRTGDIALSGGVKPLQPAMNNKLYYLVTDKLYTQDQSDIVISLATEIPVAIVSGKYEGSFVFNNPNEYENLYLIWDYSDSMDGGTASYSGGEVTKYIDVDFEDDLGTAGIDYNVTDTPARFILKDGSRTLADSGFVGLNSLANYNDLLSAGVLEEDINLTSPYDGLVNNGAGSLTFQKQSVLSDAKIIAESPLPSTSWSLTTSSTSRVSFFYDATNRDNPDDTEPDCPNKNYYHDGSESLPQVGDIVYGAVDGTGVINGSNKYHLVDTVECTGPSTTTSRWILLDESGLVLATGNPHSTCVEVAAPTITQIDVEMTDTKRIDLFFEATNNPTSWEIISTYNNYEIDGGEKGIILTFTDFLGDSVTEVFGKGEVASIASNTPPVITSGSGTVTLADANSKGSLPEGLTFDTSTGALSGTPIGTGVYTVSLQAQNCFGTSILKDVEVSVVSAVKLKAFAIDSDEPQSSEALSAALSPASYEIMYHDGASTLPAVGDVIYTGPRALEKLIGNNQWYRINSSAASFQVDHKGRVLTII